MDEGGVKPVLVRLFATPAVRAECERALARDETVQVTDTAGAKVAVFDLLEESLDLQLSIACRTCLGVHRLFLSPTCTQEDCVAATFRGASGLMRYDEVESRLAQAVRQLASGYVWLPSAAVPVLSALASIIAEQHGRSVLTPQERRVAMLASRGLADKDISSLLRIALTTVRSHLRAIYKKLAIHSRREIPDTL